MHTSKEGQGIHSTRSNTIMAFFDVANVEDSIRLSVFGSVFHADYIVSFKLIGWY